MYLSIWSYYPNYNYFSDYIIRHPMYKVIHFPPNSRSKLTRQFWRTSQYKQAGEIKFPGPDQNNQKKNLIYIPFSFSLAWVIFYVSFLSISSLTDRTHLTSTFNCVSSNIICSIRILKDVRWMRMNSWRPWYAILHFLGHHINFLGN